MASKSALGKIAEIEAEMARSTDRCSARCLGGG